MGTDGNRFYLLLALFCIALTGVACGSGSSPSSGTLQGSASVAASGKRDGINVLIPSLRRKARTDSSGVFLLTDVPPGTYSLQAEENAYLLQDRRVATVTEGGITRVDFSLAPDPSVGAVVGSVLRNDLDPLGLTVWASIRQGYAFLGDMQGGVPIVDVSDPAHPTVVSTIPVTRNPPHVSPFINYGKSYMTYATEDGNFLVVANNLDGALFYNIANKAAPVPMGRVYDVDISCGGMDPSSLPSYPYPVAPGKNILHPEAVAGTGDTVYVGGQGVLLVFDISSRATPVLLKCLPSSGEGTDLQFLGNRLLYANDHVDLYDISVPGNPVHLGSYPQGGAGVAGVDGMMGVSVAGSGIRFADISDPSVPVEIGSVPTESQGIDASWDGYFYAATAGSMTVYRADPGTSSVSTIYSVPVAADYAMNVSVSGEFAYLSDKSAGLKIIRIR